MKILILSARLPFPHDTGAKIRAFQLMKALVSRHQVTLLSFYGDRREEEYFPVFAKMGVRLATVYRERINRATGIKEVLAGLSSGMPFTVTKYQDHRMMAALTELLPDHDVVHCEHMHMAQYLLPGHEKITVLDAHNVEAQIAERLVPLETNPVKRALLSWNSGAMSRFEQRVSSNFDLVLAVSQQDCDCYRKRYGVANARVMENGVDLDFFHKASPDVVEQVKLVFVGLMGWMPNSDGVKYFVNEILGKIRQEFPDVSFDIVGKDPPEDVLALSATPGVRVTGTVDDVRPYVWDAQVYVVPLRFGGGTRLKILEAFAMHKPVVSTSLGCEGIECRQGSELLIADTPSEFADAVIRLLRDPTLRTDLGNRAARLVEEHYGWLSLGEKLLLYYDEVLDESSRGCSVFNKEEM